MNINGINSDGFRVDMPAVRERKHRMVTGVVDMHRDRFLQNGNEIILGTSASELRK